MENKLGFPLCCPSYPDWGLAPATALSSDGPETELNAQKCAVNYLNLKSPEAHVHHTQNNALFQCGKQAGMHFVM